MMIWLGFRWNSARNGNLKVTVHFLKAEQEYAARKMKKKYIYVVYNDKCRYEIQEEKDDLVWYTVIYRPISSTG
jgi:hypothetical protein